MICTLCPRSCGVNRETESGFCAMPMLPVVARASLHHGEEPPISGHRGAGTVFFSGCNLHCVFCQNSVISQGGFGKTITVERLRDIFWELIRQGAHNIELVTPAHFAPAVLESLDEPLPVPVIWNSGGYDKTSLLKRLEGKVQIYLPDFKYRDAERAARYSAAPDYPEIAATAIREMVRQTGPCVFDSNGLLQRGTMVRHLLLPGGLSDAKAVMDWVQESFAPGSVYVSLMSQYVPLGDAAHYPEINRKLRRSEIRAAQDYMAALGLVGFVQEEEAACEDYVPAFDLTGV